MLDDLQYMQMAMDEAKKATGNTTPNPLVGCIIVKDGRIISKGFHKKSGEAHAELDAIQNAKESVEGATVYCNLEPCCHLNKKTPPCAQRLIQEKVKKVVIANLDPNPDVAGKGVKLLEEAGIEVVTGPLLEEGLEFNEIFFTHITKKRPFIELKYAQTLDGKIATLKHESKWITGSVAREHVHADRLKYDAILVGANTIREDDPSLTVRIQNEVKPKKRIILSLSGNLPKDAKVFNDEYKEHTILVLPENVKTSFGVEIIHSPMKDGAFDLNLLVKKFYERGIMSIYVEGGQKVLTSFLQENLFDRISVYIAPKILGTGISPFLDLGIKDLNDAVSFEKSRFLVLDKDLLFTAIRGK